MEEVLNQEQTDVTTDFGNEDEDLFSDVEVPTEENEPKEEPQEEVQEEVQEIKPFLEIQYNKELKGLSQEEAKTLAQKGMNYDKMADKYKTLESELEKLASVNGMSVNDYLLKLQDMQNELEVDKEISSLKEKYPDTNEEILKELAQQKIANVATNRIQSQQKEQNDAREAEVKRQIEEFRNVYPDITPEQIPDEVIQMAQDGKTLLGAYVLWNRSQEVKNSEDKIAKQNEENKKRSLGNTTNAGDEEPDDFFSGFNSI